ncbi:MAG: hypothetical protein BWY28_00454 [bacterium ADurb.Bin236]|nr:MAG: hypothetical protein BWY28_00454 [bacterium ADurb.Bin236]
MTRGLTSKQKAMICAIIAALVSAALLRVYLSSREATKVRLEAERTDEAIPHIVVHVKGAVKRPGLATLEAGSETKSSSEAAPAFPSAPPLTTSFNPAKKSTLTPLWRTSCNASRE